MKEIKTLNAPELSGNLERNLLQEAVREFGTPLYVYDLERIQRQFEALKSAFSGRKMLVCYALKANPNLSVVQKLAELESGADCVSIGEIKRAVLAGIPKYKIIYSGVGKQDFEIQEALRIGILFINVESKEEMLRVEACAKELGVLARISVRVNPDINPQTHPYISTGLKENKFGVSIEEAKEMYLYAHHSSFLEPVGIHFHIGSQLTKLQPIQEAAQKIARLAHSLLALKIDLKFFDVGGGIGITYQNEETIHPYDYAQAILEELRGLDLTIICEPGRFLVGNSGVFLTQVLYQKKNQGKHFVIVDGAMNDLIRPSLYGAYHQIRALKEDAESLESVDVVGPICESGDYLGKDVLLPPLERGDVLAVMSAGAYGFSMASHYNSRPNCAEVVVDNQKFKLVRKRESFEDLIAKEVECLKPL